MDRALDDHPNKKANMQVEIEEAKRDAGTTYRQGLNAEEECLTLSFFELATVKSSWILTDLLRPDNTGRDQTKKWGG